MHISPSTSDVVVSSSTTNISNWTSTENPAIHGMQYKIDFIHLSVLLNIFFNFYYQLQGSDPFGDLLITLGRCAEKLYAQIFEYRQRGHW